MSKSLASLRRTVRCWVGCGRSERHVRQILNAAAYGIVTRSAAPEQSKDDSSDAASHLPHALAA